jgi:hypothetical protein
MAFGLAFFRLQVRKENHFIHNCNLKMGRQIVISTKSLHRIHSVTIAVDMGMDYYLWQSGMKFIGQEL